MADCKLDYKRWLVKYQGLTSLLQLQLLTYVIMILWIKVNLEPFIVSAVGRRLAHSAPFTRAMSPYHSGPQLLCSMSSTVSHSPAFPVYVQLYYPSIKVIIIFVSRHCSNSVICLFPSLRKRMTVWYSKKLLTQRGYYTTTLKFKKTSFPLAMLRNTHTREKAKHIGHGSHFIGASWGFQMPRWLFSTATHCEG